MCHNFRFPWLDVSDVELGCLGLENEGWFDPYSLLNILKAGAVDLGARFINGEVIDFKFTRRMDIQVDGVEDGEYEGINSVTVREYVYIFSIK